MPASAIGPYSDPAALVKLDRRTREFRMMKRIIADLTQHVGGSPSATQRRLIERCAWLQLHVAMLDAKVASGGMLTKCDTATYLAWSNSLSRTLKLLGLDAKPQPRRGSLAGYRATNAASPAVAL